MWADKHKGDTSKLSSIQRRCARIISGAEWNTPPSRILNELRWIPIEEGQFFFNKSIMMYKFLNYISPPYLKRNFTKLQNVHSYVHVCMTSYFLDFARHFMRNLLR